jgi:hypothetical protein
LSSEKERADNIERMASAIEDLLYMGIIKFSGMDEHKGKVIFSTQFSVIVSNIMSEKKLKGHNDNEIMKLMYYSILIYMNEYLKLPKSLTMAFGNDLEHHQEDMQCSNLVSNYVTILQSIFVDQRNEIK